MSDYKKTSIFHYLSLLGGHLSPTYCHCEADNVQRSNLGHTVIPSKPFFQTVIPSKRSAWRNLAISSVMAISALFFSGVSQASDVGYYTFGQYRYFGPKMDVEFVTDGIDANTTSGKRFYNTIAKRQINSFKNTGRTFKEAMSYGDWDKPYRVMSGFEYDFRQSKTSGSSYGYNDKSGTFFLMGDKAYANNYWRLGAGVALTSYDSSYNMAHEDSHENYMAMLYAVYNDAPNEIRLRSRVYLGRGESDFKRIADINGAEEAFRGSYDSWYYGFEHSLSKTFSHNGFYLQPTVELEGYGVDRDEINEHGNGTYALNTKARSFFMLDGLVGIYAGYKGEDYFGNKYNIKVGPDLTTIFSDPYGQFYLYDNAGSETFMKKRPDYNNYLAWKAYFNYYFDNGLGIYSDFRYYIKDADSVAFALGLNYKF